MTVTVQVIGKREELIRVAVRIENFVERAVKVLFLEVWPPENVRPVSNVVETVTVEVGAGRAFGEEVGRDGLFLKFYRKRGNGQTRDHGERGEEGVEFHGETLFQLGVRS